MDSIRILRLQQHRDSLCGDLPSLQQAIDSLPSYLHSYPVSFGLHIEHSFIYLISFSLTVPHRVPPHTKVIIYRIWNGTVLTRRTIQKFEYITMCRPRAHQMFIAFATRCGQSKIIVCRWSFRALSGTKPTANLTRDVEYSLAAQHIREIPSPWNASRLVSPWNV